MVRARHLQRLLLLHHHLVGLEVPQVGRRQARIALLHPCTHRQEIARVCVQARECARARTRREGGERESVGHAGAHRESCMMACVDVCAREADWERRLRPTHFLVHFLEGCLNVVFKLFDLVRVRAHALAPPTPQQQHTRNERVHTDTKLLQSGYANKGERSRGGERGGGTYTRPTLSTLHAHREDREKRTQREGRERKTQPACTHAHIERGGRRRT
jgi:hypothetical protein